MRYYFTLLLLLTGLSSFAQHTVSGIITEENDTVLIENVQVFIPEFNRLGYTEAGGTYILRNVGIGKVHIQFTREGYKSKVVVVDTKDSATVLNVKLESSTIELEEVLVSSNQSRLPDNVPYSVYATSVDDLRRSGTINYMQALTYQPGIDRITIGNGINKPVIRGLSFNRILVMQSGSRLENQSWDDRHDLGVNENGVSKVEVIKGPASLIYGADAMGGVVIYNDEKPSVAGTKTGDINLGLFSNTLGLNLNAGFKGSNEKGFFYSFRLGGQSHTSYVQGAGETIKKNTEEKDFAFNSKFLSANAKGIIGISKCWGVSKLTYSYINQQIGIIEMEEGTSPDFEEQRDREVEAPYQDVGTHLISSENTFIVGAGKINADVSYQFNGRKEYEPIPNVKKSKELGVGLDLQTISYNVRYSSSPEKAAGFTFGVQGYTQKNTNKGNLFLVPDADIMDHAAYLLGRYDKGKWNVLAGARYDYRTMKTTSPISNSQQFSIDKKYNLLNGSLGTAFHPNEFITLKLNGSTGFTAPNYAQTGAFGKHEGAYRFEIGDPTLKVEQNYEGDFGLIVEGKSLSFRADGYINRINNYIYIANTGSTYFGATDTLPIYRYSQKDAMITGAEATLDIHPAFIESLDLMVSYGHIRGTFISGGNIPYIPANKLSGTLKFGKDKIDYISQPYISLTASHYFDQNETAEFESKTASYTLLDAHFGGSFKWGQQYFDLTVSVTNILNTGYFNALSLTKDLLPVGIRDMGRNVALNLKIPFTLKKGK